MPDDVKTVVTDTNTPAPTQAPADTKPPAATQAPVDNKPPASTPAPTQAPVDGKPPEGDKTPEGEKKTFTPEQWREELAGGDEDVLKALGRIPSQKDLVKSWMEQRKLIAAGKHKEPLPENATDEQKAEYRKANGIPEKPEDYYKSLPEGLTFGEDDKPAVTKFLEDMHGLNAPPAMVSKALEVYVAAQEESALQRAELDQKAVDSAKELLTNEWGADYTGNVNAMVGFVKANVAEEDQANFMNARMGDGTPIFSHPGMVKAFAQLGRTLNPSGATTPGAGTGSIDAIEEAIKGYENRMKNDRVNWFKDTKAQEHYRQLITAKENMNKKRA